MGSNVDHPAHYGGANHVYEAIKVIEAWNVGFHLGNTLKYICRATYKGNQLEDLKKARWYLDRKIAALESSRAPASTDPLPAVEAKPKESFSHFDIGQEYG